MKISTHRTIQISVLMDKAQSSVRIAHRGAVNLLRIGNAKGAAYLVAKADRFSRIETRCRKALSA